MAEVPKYIANIACESGYIEVYDISLRLIGYAGTYDLLYSNHVIVGQPSGSDNKYEFVDGNGILLFGNDQGLPIFDASEDWKIDVSDSKNYNAWWLALYKEDPPNNLPWDVYGGGWHLDGPPSNPVIEIADWWRTTALNNFDPGATYVVQWVANNKDCEGWNVNEQEAYICPSGWSCRFGLSDQLSDNEDNMIFPNPVISEFYLKSESNFDRLELVDLLGRTISTWQNSANSFHLPTEMPSGTYFLRILDANHKLLNSRTIQIAR